VNKANKVNFMIKKIAQFLVIVFLFIVIGIVLKNIYLSIKSTKNINKEVVALKKEADKFNQDNKNLNKLIKYFDSQEFQEKEIKNKLNLVKKGEKVVIVQNSVNDNVNEEIVKKSSKIITRHANYYYWWKYFFGTRESI
jgi:cell division protein FtsB